MRLTLVVSVSMILWSGAAARAEPEVGVMADVGIPDGMTAALAVTPHPAVTAHAGVGHNTNSFGLRGGVALFPWRWLLSPYAAVEGGMFFEADTPAWIADSARKAGLEDQTLERMGYRYANLHLGTQLGRGPAVVYLQGGVSFISATALTLESGGDDRMVDVYRETDVELWTVSGRGGLLYTF